MEYFPVKEEVPDSYTIEEEQEFETLQLKGETSETAQGINLLGHCVLCLRKLLNNFTNNEKRLPVPESNSKPKRGRGRPLGTTKKRTHEKPVREATFSRSLTTFNHIWPYLNEKWKRKVGDDISPSSIKFVRKLSKNDLFNVTEVPPICEECGAKIEELDKLHQEITSKVLEIHSIITSSGPTGALSWRGLAFEQALENASDKSAVILTKQFVDDLRTGCSLLADPLEDVDMVSELQEEVDMASDLQEDVDMVSELQDDAAFPAAEEIKKENHDDDKFGFEIPVKKRGRKKGSKPGRKKKLIYSSRVKPRKPLTPLSYKCDICNERLPCTELEDHLGTHVQDYAVKCPNYERCSYICSNRLTLEKLHFPTHPKCKAVLGDRRLERECETCGFKTNNLTTYRVHVSTHETTEKHFPCPIKDCPQSFTVRPSVLLHLDRHSYFKRRDLQICESCKKRVSVSDIEGHLKSVHNATEVLKCPECQYVFIERVKLLNHMSEIHADNNGLQCDICLDGKKHRFLRRHYYEIHKIGSQEFCELCNKSFVSKESLNSHRRKTHGKIQGRPKVKKLTRSTYSCKKCKEEFKNYSAFLYHEVRVHGADHFRCAVCSKVYSSKGALNEHEKTHDPDALPQYICEVDGCGMAFLWKNQLYHHTLRKHNPNLDPSGYPCDICGSSFKTPKNLKNHKDTIHEQKETSVCETCGKVLATKSSYGRHMLIHKGVKPFQCEICGMNFRSRSVMQTHKKIHSKDK